MDHMETLMLLDSLDRYKHNKFTIYTNIEENIIFFTNLNMNYLGK